MAERSQPTAIKDWAESFLTKGWTAHGHFTMGLGGTHDWVIVELVPRVKDAPTYRILHAPEFLHFADAETHAQILDALRAHPAQLVESFQRSERPFYIRLGWPDDFIETLAPKLAPLEPASFKWPVLVMSRNPHTNSLTLLGCPSTFNIGFPTLLDRDGSEIDEGTALMILMTCRSQENAKSETRGLKLTLTQPFHPSRLKQIVAKTQSVGAGLTLAEQRSELLQTLHHHVPQAIESLRTHPPKRDKHIISVLRSRLAESVSATVHGRPERRRIQDPRTRWQSQLAKLTPPQRELLMQTLSPAEREEVDALVGRRPSPRPASTRRVLLHRAHTKLATILGSEEAESL